MDLIVSATDRVFSALTPTSTGFQQLSDYAMARGAAAVQKQDYGTAVSEFKRAIGFQPGSADAYQNLGRTYVLMGRNDDAIAAYQKAVQVDPGNTDVRTDLAKTYMITGHGDEAEQQYQQIVRSDPTNAGARAALGYLYLQNDQLSQAESEFNAVANLAPNDPATHYSLGQLYLKQGRADAAIDELKTALTMKPDYAAAMADLGRAYFSTGDTDNANAQVDALLGLNTGEANGLASTLMAEMYTPKIAYADIAHSTFNSAFAPQCPVALLDPSLATPGASKVFSMTFQFNQSMDPTSVQNNLNWSITQASGGTAGIYNNGYTPDYGREVSISPIPISVTYDPLTYSATVYFSIRQNETGDGVIDPSHWVFSFRGTDASGNPIDPAGDQYDGAVGHTF